MSFSSDFLCLEIQHLPSGVLQHCFNCSYITVCFLFFRFYTSYLFRPLDKYYVIAFKFPQLKNMFVLFVEKNRTVYFHGDNTCFLVGTSVSLHHSNADFISLAFFFSLCLPHQKEIKGFFLYFFTCTGGAVATMCVVF